MRSHPTLKRTLISSVLVLAMTASLYGYQGDDWIKIAPVGGGFTVKMPAQPEEVVRPGDDLTTHLFRLETEKTLYMVAYGDYAPSIRLQVDDELATNRDKFLQGLSAKLIVSKSISVSGRQGLEFTGENEQATFKSRVFIFGFRFHQIAVAVFKGADDANNVDRFFSSFEFTKK